LIIGNLEFIWILSFDICHSQSMSLRTIKLTIEYDGTNFQGWQLQIPPNRTIQDEIEKVLSKITKENVRVIGSGRTDSGVHAFGQVAHFKTKSTLPASTFLKALNYHLPKDISVLRVQQVKKTFHAQFNAKKKIYRYTILNRVAPSAQQRNFVYQFPYPLNVAAMKREAKALVGRKDFRSFQAANAKGKKGMGTVRTIKKFLIRRKENLISIEIEANGFLYKMVRNIVGTLLDIGTGKLPSGCLKKILAQKNRAAASKTAPAHGLCLVKVKY